MSLCTWWTLVYGNPRQALIEERAMSKFKDFMVEAEEELFEEARTSMDECPHDCRYLEFWPATEINPQDSECRCEEKTECPRVTDDKVMTRAQDKLEEFANESCNTPEDK